MALPAPITSQPIYYSEDLNQLEAMAQRHVFEHGYNSRKAGYLLRECPPFLIEKWKSRWRDGWRKRNDEERRCEHEKEIAKSHSLRTTARCSSGWRRYGVLIPMSRQ